MRCWIDAGCFEVWWRGVQAVVRQWAGRKGSKVHIAVDTLGHLPALTVMPVDQGNREQVAALAAEVQQVTGNTVESAYVDQGYTGSNADEAAQQHGSRLEVVKHPMAKRGFVFLPRRWVVERSFAWAARLRRLARDYERLPNTLQGLHYIAFAILMTSPRMVKSRGGRLHFQAGAAAGRWLRR